jgi:hypothetical protein
MNMKIKAFFHFITEYSYYWDLNVPFVPLVWRGRGVQRSSLQGGAEEAGNRTTTPSPANAKAHKLTCVLSRGLQNQVQSIQVE